MCGGHTHPLQEREHCPDLSLSFPAQSLQWLPRGQGTRAFLCCPQKARPPPFPLDPQHRLFPLLGGLSLLPAIKLSDLQLNTFPNPILFHPTPEETVKWVSPAPQTTCALWKQPWFAVRVCVQVCEVGASPRGP